ncbi:MAG: hypothetical protein V4553_05820 [Bacteroidota bacterium]
MIKNLSFLIFGVLLWSSSFVLAQVKIIGLEPSDDNWLTKRDSGFLKVMGLTYKKPVDFDEINGTECFKFNPQLEEILTCANHQLYSKDRQFMTFFITQQLDESNENDRSIIAYIGKENIDKRHISRIKYEIWQSIGKEAVPKWKQYAQYYPAEDAKSKFNADSAITAAIKLKPEYPYYKGKYNHLKSFYLQKKGRGFVVFYCFYTDEAEKNLPFYWKAIEGVFRFDD